MRTAQAVEISVCAGLLVGVTLGFVAGVGLVVKKPERFGLVHVGFRGPPRDVQFGSAKFREWHGAKYRRARG
jgi:hypothetical protein